jgi:nicotinamidase/pyrazinamidase
MPEYEPNTALLVVDVQNDFADPAGSLYVQGGQDVVAVANREIRLAQQAGRRVLYTQDWHPPSTPHFQKDGGVWPVHCVQETWGAEFHPDLVVAGDVVRKGSGGEDGYSGFTERDPESGDEQKTRLETLLRQHDIQRVVIVGLASDYCVKETALDAMRLGFQTAVIADGIRAVDLQPGDGDRALEAMRQAGAHLA